MPRPACSIDYVRHSNTRLSLPSTFRFLHTSAPSRSSDPSSPQPRTPEETAAYFRKRKAEWKRRQHGQNFLDHIYVTVKAGKGGDGCTAFAREKFVAYGPPSGGNGGRGGSVYVRAVPTLTSLASVSKRVTAAPGQNGQGSFRNGGRVPHTYIDVPVGTVVREVVRDRERREAEEKARWEGLSAEEQASERREKMWVHYPQYKDINEGDGAFLQAEQAMQREENARRREEAWRRSEAAPLEFDLSEPDTFGENEQGGGVLVASGGQGGLGNPYFASATSRSPRFATRGRAGEQVLLELELKLLADVGLVGFPNAGKSTLLRALTNSRAEVAPYAFTTLNPQVGIVRIWDDGTFEPGRDDLSDGDVPASASVAETSSSVLTTTTGSNKLSKALRTEAMRFTIADNPGLLAGASENVGLGHSFLRSIERSLALVYVVDFSSPAPWDELETLRTELEAYKPGLSGKARMVVANKADLAVDDEGDAAAVGAARAKLERLKRHVAYMAGVDERTGERVGVEVVAVSGKYRQNLGPLVRTLGEIVVEERAGAEAARGESELGSVEWTFES